jgi:SAM-dependent methyltransferase
VAESDAGPPPEQRTPGAPSLERLRPRSAADFEAAYAGTPAWEIGRPQPAFVALAECGLIRGCVLDAGCGSGEHALLAASLGLEATGIDTAAAAIAAAQAKADERGLAARFLVWDARQLASLGGQFDTVLDSGLFHVLGDGDRRLYVEGLAAILRPGGRYLMLCFSERQPGRLGPRRVSAAEIRACFRRGWRIDSIEPARLITTMRPEGAAAWLACITRLGESR